MSQSTGKYMIIFGLIMMLAGLLIYFFHGKMNWLGKLPGDIRVEKENFKFFFPVTTMIILSVVLNIVIWVIEKYFNTDVSSKKYNNLRLMPFVNENTPHA